MENHKNIFDFLLICAKHKKLIISLTAIVAIIAVVYSLITPQIWTSKATFKPDASSSTGISANIVGLSGIVSSLAGISTGDAQYSLIILRSRTFNEDVIRKFRLIDYFEIKDSDSLQAMDQALEQLKSNVLSVGLNDENGLISISISTKNKKFSKDIADYYLMKLDEYNREFKLTKGKRNRQFYESRVAEARSDIDSLTVSIRDFQKKNKAIDITAQMSSLIDLYSEAVSQKMIADMELDVAKLNQSADSPLVTNLIQRQKILHDRIKELEKSSDNFKPQYIIDIDKIPDLTLQYKQLMINLEVQKKVYEYLFPQYEVARIEELKDMPTIEVIDHPRLAGMRTRPKRAFICVVATLLGFIFSVMIAFLKDYADNNKDKVQMLKQAFLRKRSS